MQTVQDAQMLMLLLFLFDQVRQSTSVPNTLDVDDSGGPWIKMELDVISGEGTSTAEDTDAGAMIRPSGTSGPDISDVSSLCLFSSSLISCHFVLVSCGAFG